jgi:hypothetical protein
MMIYFDAYSSFCVSLFKLELEVEFSSKEVVFYLVKKGVRSGRWTKEHHDKNEIVFTNIKKARIRMLRKLD